MTLFCEEKNGFVLLKVYVQPGAKKNQIIGLHNHELKIKLSAPPVEGAANKELLKFISKFLKLNRSQVALISGEKSRHKIIQLSGITEQEVTAIFLQGGIVTIRLG